MINKTTTKRLDSIENVECIFSFYLHCDFFLCLSFFSLFFSTLFLFHMVAIKYVINAF